MATCLHRNPILRAPLLTAALLLSACPAPTSEGDTSTTTTTTTSTTGTSSSGVLDPSSSTTADPDGGTSSTTATVDTGTGDTDTTGSSIDDPGCPECMVLATGLQDGRGITVDLDYVYFTDQGRGTVERVHKGGGSGSVLVTDQDAPFGVAVSNEHVYWTNFVANGAVRRAPLAGGLPTLVSDSPFPRPVTVAGDQVYWGTFESDAGTVMRVPTALDVAPTELTWVAGGVADLVVGGDRVFFTAHSTSGGAGFIEPPPMGPPIGAVFATPPGPGPFDPFDVEQLASSVAEPWGIALQGDTVSWVDGDGDAANQPRSVLSVPTAGGASQPLATNQGSPWDIAADEQYVYWTDFTEVKAVPIAGGEVIVLAEQQNNARSIVVDEQWVFWITRERVLQRPKP